ncbi:MAG: FAD-binding protein [Deltaproteobacteria bacterium]|nr:FAD-binding protein [Deltaproteobacteria bacterium]
MPERTVHTTDVLIIGGGIAAAFAALKARDAGASVLLADKSFFGRSGCSALASGVYPTYMPGDDEQAWLRSFAGPLVNQPLVMKALPIMYEHLMLMDRCGVKWVKEGERIIRLGGPGRNFDSGALMGEGGPQMMMAVRGEVLRRGVQVLSRIMITDLLTSDGCHPTGGRVVGALGFHSRTGALYVIRAKATIMCTGPYKFPYPKPGSLLGYMPIDLSGDGIAMMLRVGAELSRLELGGINIYPDGLLCAPGLESLMPSGARFVDRDGRRFLEAYDPKRLELTSRALLYFAIATEHSQGRRPAIDLTGLPPERAQLLAQVIPIIIQNYRTAGYDVTHDWIPYTYQVAGTSGIFGAGARITEQGETSVPGLYAAGTCSDMAYLPGGHLPFCSVSGHWAGEQAGAEVPGMAEPSVPEAQVEALAAAALAPLGRADGLSFEAVHEALGQILVEEVGLVMSGTRLERAIGRVSGLLAEQVPRLRARDPHELAKVHALVNYTQILEPILRAYLYRTESRVAFMREDFPDIDNEQWLKMVIVQRRDGALRLWDEPIPSSFHLVPPRRTKSRHLAFRSRDGAG